MATERNGPEMPDKPRPQTQFHHTEELPAHVWHSRRRLALLQHPEVKNLIRDAAGTLWGERAIVMSIMVVVFTVHFVVASALDRYAKSASAGMGALAVVVAAASVGAQCAFLVQALCHECSHGLQQRCSPMFFYGACLLGSSGAALCHIPWAAYYFGGGHARHHRFAGSRRDIDGDALFWLWEKPRGGTILRFCWLSGAAVFIPVAYGVSLFAYAMHDIKANLRELGFVSFDFVLTLVVHYMAGRVGAAYLLLSAFFSMGFLCHPLLAFWLLQHLCVGARQPTVSYYGSHIWNWLCLNELLHVEHHDLAGISFRHLPKLRTLVPELYDGIHAEMSIFSLIWDWLTSGNGLYQWDFGCRAVWESKMLAAELLASRNSLSRSALYGKAK